MIRLAAIRAVPLSFRPAALIAEATLIEGGFTLVIVVPMAALGLTLAGIPVHVNFYRSKLELGPDAPVARAYRAGVTFATLAALALLVPAMMLGPFSAGPVLTAAVLAGFLVEKCAAEASRALEFRRAWASWFGIQVARSAWLFLPIAAAVLGAPYELSVLLAGLAAAALNYALAKRIIGMGARLSLEGWPIIRENLALHTFSALNVSYRQGPRLLVTLLYPNYAHLYQAVAQICQGATLLFAVRFQIPYLRQIARRTRLMERRLRPVMSTTTRTTAVIAAVYIVLAGWLWPADAGPFVIVSLLLPVMLAEALAFAVLQTHLAYVVWSVPPGRAFRTFLLCVGLAAGAVALVWLVGLVPPPVLALPAVATLIGLLWVQGILWRHFPAHG